MTLKEQYWHDGFVFRFRNGGRRMVWKDKLIDRNGYIPKVAMSDDLVFTHSTLGDRVVEIYGPNQNIGCLGDFVKCKTLVWQKSQHILTVDDIKEKLGIPYAEELIIVKE